MRIKVIVTWERVSKSLVAGLGRWADACAPIGTPEYMYTYYGCGTTQPLRRGFPETLKQVTLERGEHLFCQGGNLVASVWMDKKPVNILSTLAQADVTRTAQRKQKDGSRISVQCTDAVVLYNKYMAGVDKGDQMRQYYHVRTKCTKYCFFLM